MLYTRVAYMCPECCQIRFFNIEEEFSTICPECNVEMSCIEKKVVSSEAEKRHRERLDRAFSNPSPLVYCPYCNSIDTSKITTTSKVINTAIFGVFGTKRYKQWHCNDCGSDF